MIERLRPDSCRAFTRAQNYLRRFASAAPAQLGALASGQVFTRGPRGVEHVGFRSVPSSRAFRPVDLNDAFTCIDEMTRQPTSVVASALDCPYQLVQVIRTRLRQAEENASWTTLRRVPDGQQRVTATFRRADGATLHVRKPTRAEPPQQAIYDALGVDPVPGGIRKTIV